MKPGKSWLAKGECWHHPFAPMLEAAGYTIVHHKVQVDEAGKHHQFTLGLKTNPQP